jgi:hypothetical protein
MRVEARLALRRELAKSSSAPSTIPAGTPRKMTPRKTKVSPAVTTTFVPGTRAGSIPEMTTRLARTTNCAHSVRLNVRQW